jgi:hypothetical protein
VVAWLPPSCLAPPAAPQPHLLCLQGVFASLAAALNPQLGSTRLGSSQKSRHNYLEVRPLESGMMLACYPGSPDGTATGYVAHLDNPRGLDPRKLSAVFYLNEAWEASHCGELRLKLRKPSSAQHAGGSGSEAVDVDIAPEAGRLVVFFSELIVHEVRPSTVPRFAVTQWFVGESATQPRGGSGGGGGGGGGGMRRSGAQDLGLAAPVGAVAAAGEGAGAAAATACAPEAGAGAALRAQHLAVAGALLQSAQAAAALLTRGNQADGAAAVLAAAEEASLRLRGLAEGEGNAHTHRK